MDFSKRVTLMQPALQGGSLIRKLLNSGPTALWPLWDTLGSSTAEEITGTTGSSGELVPNGDFETDGAGGADVFGSWTESAGDGAVAKATAAGEFHGGAAGAKLTSGPSFNTYLYRQIDVLPGIDFAYSFWTRGDGAHGGQYRIRDVTNGADIVAWTNTGVTGATFTEITENFTMPAGYVVVQIYFRGPLTNAAYMIVDDVSLTSTEYPLTGACSNVTLGQAGVGDGKTSGLFNGATSKVGIFSNALVSVFDGTEGSLGLYLKVADAGVWTDAANRRAFLLYTDDQNHAYLANRCDLANGQFRCGYAANNVHKSINVILGYTNFFSAIMTWSATADQNKFFVNGLQQTDISTSLDVHTGLGAYTGDLTAAYIGAGGDGVFVWDGWLAYAALWDRPLSPAEILGLARP